MMRFSHSYGSYTSICNRAILCHFGAILLSISEKFIIITVKTVQKLFYMFDNAHM